MPKLSQKEYLDKEVFDMKIDPSGFSKVKKGNIEKIHMLEMEAQKDKKNALRKLGSM